MCRELEQGFLTEDMLNAGQTKHFEGAFTQGSGYLHIRGSFEEGLLAAPQNESYMRLPANVTIEKPRHPRSKCGTYLPGVTGLHPLLKEELVNLPNPLCFCVKADGEFLDMDGYQVQEYERRLDLKTGILYRNFLWKAAGGGILECRYVRYVSRSRKNLIVQKMYYRARQSKIFLELASDTDTEVRTNGYQHFKEVEKTVEGNCCRTEVLTDNEDRIRILSLLNSGQAVFEEYLGKNVANIGMEDGEELLVQKLTVMSASRDPEGLKEFSELEVLLNTLCTKEEELKKEHEEAMTNLWMPARVVIDGDPEAQRALDFSTYHLLRCAGTDDRIAICAKGFAGEAYFGHFFWDTEIYMLPFYLYTMPQLAEKLARFRIRTQKGAMKNAADYGYRGARYPWESGITGEEQCPNWQYADHEVHITADVVFGLWHYFENTQDEDFLEDAAVVFLETARYWCDRSVTWEDGTVHIQGVMGPDEYICFCDDNAYTNYMAAKSLAITRKAVELLKENRRGGSLIEQVEPAFLEEIKRIQENLTICREGKILLQCRQFPSLEEPAFDRYWKDRSRPFGQFVSQERNYRTKALKQADTLMLFYLFPEEMKGESLEENYQYYLPYTTHDSSLSCIIHSILCAARKEPEEAYLTFQRALQIDLDASTNGAAEGIHIANCGGIWQAVIFGFAGMSRAYESEELRFAPCLPSHWEGIHFQVMYRGRQVKVDISREGVWLNGERQRTWALEPVSTK